MMSCALILSLTTAFSTYLRVRGGWLWAMLLLFMTAAFDFCLIVLVSSLFYATFDNPIASPVLEWISK